MARFGEKLKVEWPNNQLIPTLLLSIYSGRWAAWRGGKENPHRHYADGGQKREMLKRVSYHAHVMD